MPRIFLNISNHPIEKWEPEQIIDAIEFTFKKGERDDSFKEREGKFLKNLPFPSIDPHSTKKGYLLKLRTEYLKKVQALGDEEEVVVHLMGEQGFCYLLINGLKGLGYTVLYSTTERVVEEKDGVKTSKFKFIQFREY